MKSKVIFVSVLFIILCFSYTNGEVPKMINYQGKITNPQGGLVNSTVSMIFSVYDDSTNGITLWTETHDSVKVEKGIFSILLGSVNEIPDSVFDGNIRYLGITVNDDSEMTPRKVIASVGYAYKSEYADTADYAQVAVSDGDWTPDTSGINIYRLTGNVGIGTPTPDRQLDIAGHSGKLRVLGIENIAEVILETLGDGGVQWQWQTGNNVSTMNGRLRLLAGPHEWLTILPDGNVGIGKANPQGRLDINGSLAVAGNEGIAGQVLTSQGSGASPVWSSISQTKLKTSTGEVSGTMNETLELPGGQYCFSIQGKASITGTNSWYHYGNGDWAHEHVGQMGTTYKTLVCVSALGGATVYVGARYVTSSGKDHWMFFLIDKNTKQVVAGYQAPDHPCYGSSGDENDIPHPFGNYDPQKHEVILIDNGIMPELKSKVTSKRSLLTIINEEYEIDFGSDPVYQPREIVEIDEYGDKGGEILQKIKTPEWAKILIGKDEIYLKRRMVETLPDYISYKKLRLKSEAIVEAPVLSQNTEDQPDKR